MNQHEHLCPVCKKEWYCGKAGCAKETFIECPKHVPDQEPDR